MKLRTVFVFAAGMAAGLALAHKMTEDDPEVLHGPSAAATSNPTLRIFASGAQKVADRAGVTSLDAIRLMRGKIRQRLGDDGYDEAAWS